jgi:hypothetical protein
VATAYLRPDKGTVTLPNSTSLGTAQIIPFAAGSDGEHYLLGTPVEVMTTYRIDGVNRKFQKKVRTVWVHTAASESDWIDVHTGDACP